MLIRGFSRNTLDANRVIKPNQGIRNSFSNGIRVGLFAGVTMGIVIFVYYSYVIHNVLTTGFASQIPANSNMHLALG